MFFNYVCELKTTSNMAGTMVFGDLLQNCVNQRLFEAYNAPEYERIQMLHKLSGLYSEAYENTGAVLRGRTRGSPLLRRSGRRRGRFHAQRRDAIGGWALLPVFRRR